MKNQEKNQSVTEWYRCGKCGVTDTNIECLCYRQVEAVEYLKLSNVRQGNTSAVTGRKLNLPVEQFVFSNVADYSPTTLLNLSTCTIFRAQNGVFCETSYLKPLRNAKKELPFKRCDGPR